MIGGPAYILGGLPIWAEIRCGCDSGPWGDDYWCEVEAVYWLKKDGTKGKPLPPHILDKAEKKDQYWQADVTEAVTEYWASMPRPEPEPTIFAISVANVLTKDR